MLWPLSRRADDGAALAARFGGQAPAFASGGVAAPVQRRRRPARKRRRERERRPRGQWVRPAIGVLVLLEMVLLGGHALRWVRSSPLFSLTRVVLRGNRRLSAQVLLRQAALSPEMNLFDVDLEMLRRRIEKHPWVRRVNVRRRPPHALRIEIVERRPAARLTGEGALTVDREGVVLGGPEPAGTRCLPLIEGIDTAGLRAGGALRAPAFRPAMAAALLLAEVPEVRRSCLAVRPLKGGKVRVRTLDGTLELYVREASMAAQVARLRMVAGEILAGRGGRAPNRLELDLTFPGRIIVRTPGKEGGTKG